MKNQSKSNVILIKIKKYTWSHNMKKLIYTLLTITMISSFSAYAKTVKASSARFHISVGSNDMLATAFEAGLIYESEGTRIGFIELLDAYDQPIRKYPVAVTGFNVGALAEITSEVDFKFKLRNTNGKTINDILGTYRGGSIGLTVILGLEAGVLFNSNNVILTNLDPSGGLGVELTYSQIKIEKYIKLTEHYEWGINALGSVDFNEIIEIE